MNVDINENTSKYFKNILNILKSCVYSRMSVL